MTTLVVFLSSWVHFGLHIGLHKEKSGLGMCIVGLDINPRHENSYRQTVTNGKVCVHAQTQSPIATTLQVG